MLEITVPAKEYFNDKTETFLNIPEQTLQLEHSLYTISKWEAKWNKAFLGRREKTPEESDDYIRCMTLTDNVDPMVYLGLTPDNRLKIKEYLNAQMCATYLPKRTGDKESGDTVTAELIYYWMVSLQIPFECQYWHLNRLLTLIRVCNLKNNPPKSRSAKDIGRQNALINAQRQAMYHSRG